jgi:hypothetical protein
MRSVFLSAAFILGILVLTAHRAPAPIHENPESPTPAPKRKQLHASSQPTQERAPPKPAPEKAVSFAGTWKGTASGPSKQALIGTVTMTSNYNLQVSPDEKRVSWTSSAWMFAHFQAPARKNGRTLSWTYERHDIAGHSNIAVKMEMNPDGTATLMEYTGMTNGAFKGYSYQLIGRLIRQ